MNEMQKNFLLQNYISKGPTYCQEQLQIEIKYLVPWARKLGLEYDYIGDFLQNSPESVYTVGFFTGDGHVAKSGKHISIEINEDDANDLDKIFSFTDWRRYVRKRKNWQTQRTYRINNKKLNLWMQTLDFRTKSSCLPNISFISENMMHYFMLGLFDADGYVSLRKNHGACGIYSCYEYDWSDILNITPDDFTFKIRLCKRKNKNGKIHKYSAINLYNSDDVLDFYEYLYQDYDKNQIGLTRKYEKFQYLASIN